jgi:hypothetical protein
VSNTLLIDMIDPANPEVRNYIEDFCHQQAA